MQIDFEFNSEYGVFRDALYLPDDAVFSDAEIDAIKQQRFDNWIAHINAASTSNPDVTTIDPVALPADNPDDYIVVNGVTYKKV